MKTIFYSVLLITLFSTPSLYGEDNIENKSYLIFKEYIKEIPELRDEEICFDGLVTNNYSSIWNISHAIGEINLFQIMDSLVGRKIQNFEDSIRTLKNINCENKITSNIFAKCPREKYSGYTLNINKCIKYNENYYVEYELTNNESKKIIIIISFDGTLKNNNRYYYAYIF